MMFKQYRDSQNISDGCCFCSCDAKGYNSKNKLSYCVSKSTISIMTCSSQSWSSSSSCAGELTSFYWCFWFIEKWHRLSVYKPRPSTLHSVWTQWFSERFRMTQGSYRTLIIKIKKTKNKTYRQVQQLFVGM